MKANFALRADAPADEQHFEHPFFQRFTLRPAPRALRLSNELEKNYQFPTFYNDVSCAIGIFMCSYAKAEALMPDPRIRPVRMPGGRSLVIFSCYEYRHVMGVWPYNEIAMTIPVMAGASFSPPLLPMLAPGLFPRFGYYVVGMPVTSKENELRGRGFWGLPKVTQEIDIEPGHVIAREPDGTAYFTLTVPTQGKPTHFDVRGQLYSKLDGRILKSQTCFQGDFNVTKNMKLLRGPSDGKAAALTIGSSPMGADLRALDIDPVPFQTRYCKSMNAAFDLPADNFTL